MELDTLYKTLIRQHWSNIYRIEVALERHSRDGTYASSIDRVIMLLGTIWLYISFASGA